MDSMITYPFIRTELDHRRAGLRSDIVRRHRARPWSRRGTTRTDVSR